MKYYSIHVLVALPILCSCILPFQFIACFSPYYHTTRASTILRTETAHPNKISNISPLLPSTKRKTNGTIRTSSSNNPLFIQGPSPETKPKYEQIHGPLGYMIDKLFLTIFRAKFAAKVGIDSKLPNDDYQGLMELTTALNTKFEDKEKVRLIAQDVLRSLFPSWLPGAFAIMFAKPFPKFSSRMNAWATWVAGTWLMGECEINDCKIDGGGIGERQGLLVKRCRFLEESGCASVCVNSCKIPTQTFFIENMGLPLTMAPDYETYECQFSFGLTPTDKEELEAMNVPCLARCPTLGGLKKHHSSFSIENKKNQYPICQQMFD